jgi:polysaccharide biosynthesis/export protein
MRKTWRCLALVAVLVVTVRAEAQENRGTASIKAAPVADSGVASDKRATDDSNYLIGSQDVIDVSVWKEPDLSRTVPVRPDGRISLPLINDVQAAGLTPQQLASLITQDLKKYVTNPQVTVIVSQINSQRVYILGEVTRPGAYPLVSGMRVLQALSSAGGFTQYSKISKIYVLRQQNALQEKYPFNYKAVVGGKQAEENFELKAGDTIIVP